MFGVAPNISGSAEFGKWNEGVGLAFSETTGVFHNLRTKYSDQFGLEAVNNVPQGLGFDASQAKGQFGKSDTIQPASLRLLVCIKS